MGTERTAWHVLFAALIEERAPREIEVRSEVPLTTEPQRGDLLLLRRRNAITTERGDAQVLRSLWPVLPGTTVAEFKSVRRPFARGDLVRLIGYGCQYHVAAMTRRDLATPPVSALQDLALVLIVADDNHALHEEIAMLGLDPRPIADGYWHLVNIGLYPLYLVQLDRVAAAERDELLGIFSHAGVHSTTARWWLERHGYLPGGRMNVRIDTLPDYDDVIAKFLEHVPAEEILRAVTPERLLAAISPEQRLAGLPPEQAVLALPNAVLQGLAEDYVAGLPAEVRDAIRKRLQRT